MFANTQMMGIDSGFPDVAKVPSMAGPIPVPYPNMGTSGSDVPADGLFGGIGNTVGKLLGGFDPSTFLSMMGGGETSHPAPPSSPSPGSRPIPSAIKTLLMSP